MKEKWFLSVLIIGAVLMMGISAQAQETSSPAKCGDIIENEFTTDAQPQGYSVTMAPGDSLQVSATPLGDTLKLALVILAPNKAAIGLGGEEQDGVRPSQNAIIQTGVLSARGEYLIIANNDHIYRDGSLGDWQPGGVGVYTLYIGCTLRDGTVIEPGDNETASGGGGTTGEATSVIVAPFTGIGFPGVSSKDFSDGITIPFTLGQPNSGAINPGFESVFGFTLEASAGDKLDLSFTRTAGNLNLGLAVLSADNKIVYQASLVTADSMNVLFTLPGSSQYTIGVWKIALLPPESPENTAFQLTGTLNP